VVVGEFADTEKALKPAAVRQQKLRRLSYIMPGNRAFLRQLWPAGLVLAYETGGF
jgi:hypothetical protein